MGLRFHVLGLLSFVIPRSAALFSLNPKNHRHHQLPETFVNSDDDSSSSEQLTTPEQRQAFEEDGYIVLRGLFDPKEIDDMVNAGNSIVDQSQQGKFDTFSVVEPNLVYGALDTQKKKNNDDHHQSSTEDDTNKEIVSTFRNVALRSKLPQICAELMGLDPSTQCVRVIRDVFLAKYLSTDKTCDWHVDDQGFWPESFLSSASESSGRDQDGINAWIALDDYTPAHGGYMIVSKGSHKAEWRHEAYLSIGQNRTQDGGSTREETIARLQNPKPNSTCILDVSNPAVRALAEEGRVDFALKKGDCILATRLLFHRTCRVTQKGMKHYQQQQGAGPNKLLHRYSVRYVPGSARLPRAFARDLSVLYSGSAAGKTLDHISRTNHPAWYPKVWPQVETDVDAKLDELAVQKVPIAKARREAAMQEFIKLVKHSNIRT